MATVRALDFEQWAGRADAQSNFGELIRRLVHASVPHGMIREIGFYAAEANQLSGWDGILDCTYTGNAIPDGRSVWELGGGLRDKAKIKKDFVKRQTAGLPNGWKKDETTYIAATFHKLKDRTNFEKELIDIDGGWKNIKIIDATVFEEWIFPLFSVQGWLQTLGVGRPTDIKSLEHMWSSWSKDTVPSMSTELMLVSRKKESKEVHQFLLDKSGHIKIRSDSSEEAIAFVYAAISSIEDNKIKLSHLSRAIVVSDPVLCDDLNRIPPHIIILRDYAVSKAAQLSRHGHLVISAQGNSVVDENILLNRSIGRDFIQALKNMGVSDKYAEVGARACGSSASVWRIWNLYNFSGGIDSQMRWAAPEYADIVVPVILMGGWSEKYIGDLEIIKDMTGMEYGEFRDKLNIFNSMDHPLLAHVDDIYVVSAPAVAFALCIPYITQGHLQKFYDVLIKVFSEVSPYVNLKPDERPFANMHGNINKYSSWLRDGLAERLLQMVVIGNDLAKKGKLPKNHRTCQSFADDVIRSLPGLRDNYRLIASLERQLPVLMEAAPLPFIEALSQWAQGRREIILPIFEEGSPGFSHTLHTNTLWGLETLAWSPEYLSDVAMILCALASVDPGGNMMNRPINSLKEIFLAWHPGTSASNAQKSSVLDLIISSYPEIAWDLLNAIMPSHHAISHMTSKPKWKDFGRYEMPMLLNRDVWESYQNYFDKTLLLAKQDKSRLPKLIDYYPNVSDKNQKIIENEFNNLKFHDDENEIKLLIWKTLRDFTNRHIKFNDAEWAIKSNKIKRLQKIAKKIEPDEESKKSTWLFDDYFPDVPTKNDNYDDNEAELNKLRGESIKAIWEIGGMDKLKTFIDEIKHPQFIAPYLIDLINNIDTIKKIAIDFSSGSDNQKFIARNISGYASERFANDWGNWVFSLISVPDIGPDIFMNLLRGLPTNIDIFRRVDVLDQNLIDKYWSEVSFWMPRDNESLIFMIKKAIQYKRTIDIFTLINHKLNEVSLGLVLEYFRQFCIDIVNKPDHLPRVSNLSYYLEKLFGWLKDNPEMDQSELAKMEYQFLPLLASRHKHNNLALHEIMAKDPRFYVDVICDVFMPASMRGQDREESTDPQLALRAKHGWYLLDSWQTIPGQISEKELNGDILSLWVLTVREIAKDKDRSELADQYIGKMLYHAGSIDSKDGLWPHEAVRDILESIKSEDIESGMSIEASNSRGVTTRALFEGGRQERELEAQWRDRESKLRTSYSRTAGVCRDIAELWERHAQFEDDSAEKDKLKYNS